MNTDPPITLDTRHGPLALPCFLPDATRGVVRGVGADDLERCGIAAVVANAFHLGVNPGSTVLGRNGGLHAFLSWPRPIATDSGGFQIYSLLRENPGKGKVNRDGFTYAPRKGARRFKLTAEKSIRVQLSMGADIVVCLDHCTHPEDTRDQQAESVANTIAWARESKEAFERLAGDAKSRPLLFAVVQGGASDELRRECAARLLEIGFDGYGFGGWPIDEGGALRPEVRLVAKLIPPGVPLWGLGIGSPDNIAAAFAAGYRLFDCALPTRDARAGRLLTEPTVAAGVASRRANYAYIYIRDDEHRRSQLPVDEACDCPACARYARGYLHHLFNVRDTLAIRLATIHNLRFYARLMEKLRAANVQQ